MVERVLRIEGMSCDHCVRAVTEALRATPGVRAVDVSIGRARVESDESVTQETLAAAIANEGYRVSAAN